MNNTKPRIKSTANGLLLAVTLVACLVILVAISAAFWAWIIMLAASAFMDTGPSFRAMYPAGIAVALAYAATFGRVHYK